MALRHPALYLPILASAALLSIKAGAANGIDDVPPPAPASPSAPPSAPYAPDEPRTSDHETDPPDGSSLTPATSDAPATAPDPPPTPPTPPTPSAPTKAEPTTEESTDLGIAASIDFVAGGANLDVVAQGPLISGTRNFTSVVDSSRVAALSILPYVQYALKENLVLGARVPIIMGDIESRTGAVTTQRNLFIGGNLAFNGTFTRPLSRLLALDLGLDLALPTGGGEEPPTTSDVLRDPSRAYNFASTDRFALARAAEFTRGSLDTALFAPDRLGLVPKITLRGRARRLQWSAWLQVENLIATSRSPEDRYVGEVALGARAFYQVHRHIEPGLHAWTNITFAAHRDRRQTGVLLEPTVRFPFEHLTPYVGVLLPVLGDFVDQKTFGIRLGAQARF